MHDICENKHVVGQDQAVPLTVNDMKNAMSMAYQTVLGVCTSEAKIYKTPELDAFGRAANVTLTHINWTPQDDPEFIRNSEAHPDVLQQKTCCDEIDIKRIGPEIREKIYSINGYSGPMAPFEYTEDQKQYVEYLITAIHTVFAFWNDPPVAWRDMYAAEARSLHLVHQVCLTKMDQLLVSIRKSSGLHAYLTGDTDCNRSKIFTWVGIVCVSISVKFYHNRIFPEARYRRWGMSRQVYRQMELNVLEAVGWRVAARDQPTPWDIIYAMGLMMTIERNNTGHAVRDTIRSFYKSNKDATYFNALTTDIAAFAATAFMTHAGICHKNGMHDNTDVNVHLSQSAQTCQDILRIDGNAANMLCGIFNH